MAGLGIGRRREGGGGGLPELRGGVLVAYGAVLVAVLGSLLRMPGREPHQRFAVPLGRAAIMRQGPEGIDTPEEPHVGAGVDSGSTPDGSTLTWIVGQHHQHMEEIIRKEQTMHVKADLPIEDRLVRRVEIFAPGGDTEKLMLEAAAKITEMRREIYEMTLLATAYADRWQKALARGGDR